MAFAGFLVRFRPDRDIDPRFLEYCAGSKAFSAAVESDAVTSTISNFNAEKYGEVRLPDLEQSAQRAIADYLDKETSRIDAVTVTLERQIKLLREHRQALIANAVTGDLEVPRVAA
jgi:type I restriction enzyme S subunit